MKKRSGFTLIELMLVVIILGILVSMVAPRLTGRSEEARIKVATADIGSSIPTALKLYELDNGKYPSTEAGLKALLEPVSSARNWKGPYLDHKPLDPWGKEYQYRYPGTRNKYDYDLWSLGSDLADGTEDDVTNWDKK